MTESRERCNFYCERDDATPAHGPGPEAQALANRSHGGWCCHLRACLLRLKVFLVCLGLAGRHDDPEELDGKMRRRRVGLVENADGPRGHVVGSTSQEPFTSDAPHPTTLRALGLELRRSVRRAEALESRGATATRDSRRERGGSRGSASRNKETGRVRCRLLVPFHRRAPAPPPFSLSQHGTKLVTRKEKKVSARTLCSCDEA